MRTGATHTRSSARDIDIHNYIDTRTYDAGPCRTPKERQALAGRGVDALMEMGAELDRYYSAPPAPDDHPALISDEENDQ